MILLDELAYKIKKPVRLGFLDFSTEDARRRACYRELELNRRIAPDVYLDVATLSGSDGVAREHVLVMRRLPDELRLATLVRQGASVDRHLHDLAVLLSAFHHAAPRGPRIAAEGGAEGLHRRWADNLRETERFRDGVIDSGLHERINTLALDYVAGRAELLADRAGAGLVVDGHGDLQAEDIFCLADGPRVLDCIEFDDRLRWVDVVDDVAFLAMDLERLGRPELAARLLGDYTRVSGVQAPSSLVHHYIAYRAFVRAKVACIRAEQDSPGSVADARALTALTLRHLLAGEMLLVLVGGAPGTGKTTVAAALAERLDAAVIATDTVRGELALTTRNRYTPGAKLATYHRLLARARHQLAHGRSVVADATWPSAQLRALAGEVATQTNSRLVALECQAPDDVAAARADARFATGRDASEADGRVARRLAAERDPWPGAVPIDTRATPRVAVAAALSACQACRES